MAHTLLASAFASRRTRPRSRELRATSSFVRLATRAHGGDATVFATPGGGTTFRVTIPAPVEAPVVGR